MEHTPKLTHQAVEDISDVCRYIALELEKFFAATSLSFTKIFSSCP